MSNTRTDKRKKNLYSWQTWKFITFLQLLLPQHLDEEVEYLAACEKFPPPAENFEWVWRLPEKKETLWGMTRKWTRHENVFFFFFALTPPVLVSWFDLWAICARGKKLQPPEKNKIVSNLAKVWLGKTLAKLGEHAFNRRPSYDFKVWSGRIFFLLRNFLTVTGMIQFRQLFSMFRGSFLSRKIGHHRANKSKKLTTFSANLRASNLCKIFRPKDVCVLYFCSRLNHCNMRIPDFFPPKHFLWSGARLAANLNVSFTVTFKGKQFAPVSICGESHDTSVAAGSNCARFDCIVLDPLATWTRDELTIDLS